MTGVWHWERVNKWNQLGWSSSSQQCAAPLWGFLYIRQPAAWSRTGHYSHGHISIKNWYIQPNDGLKCLRAYGKHNKMPQKVSYIHIFKMFRKKVVKTCANLLFFVNVFMASSNSLQVNTLKTYMGVPWSLLIEMIYNVIFCLVSFLRTVTGNLPCTCHFR